MFDAQILCDCLVYTMIQVDQVPIAVQAATRYGIETLQAYSQSEPLIQGTTVVVHEDKAHALFAYLEHMGIRTRTVG